MCVFCFRALQGWVECAGHADRSAFDLTQHSRATNSKLVAEKKLATPRTVQVSICLLGVVSSCKQCLVS